MHAGVSGRVRGYWAAVGAVVVATAACGDGARSRPGPDDFGTVVLAVQTVPSDIKCIKIVSAGSLAFATQFTVTPGGSTALTMPGVSPGSVTFSGEAYPLACTSVTASTVATWIADPVVATVVAGATTNVALTMRPAGNVGLTVDFQGGAGAQGIPLGVWDSTNWGNAIWQ